MLVQTTTKQKASKVVVNDSRVTKTHSGAISMSPARGTRRQSLFLHVPDTDAGGFFLGPISGELGLIK